MSHAQDVLIVGGGAAGAALGVELAAAGRDVALIEKEAEPHHKVCGEFLSAGALGSLERLGLDVATLGAVPIWRVGLSRKSWRVERPLPFRAMSLSRKALDEALLVRAAESGVEVMRGLAVRGVAKTGDLWRARLADASVVAREAVLATGKHDVRGRRRPAGLHDDLIGFKTHLFLREEARRKLAGCVEIGLFPGGYAGLEPIEHGRANLCLVVSKSAYARLGGGWAALFGAVKRSSQAFEMLLDGAEQALERRLAISRIPYGLVRRTSDGPWLIGDQAAVVPSFAGEGLSFALHGARLAARRMLAGGTAGAFQAELASDVSGQIRLATTLSRLVVRPDVQRLAPLLAPALLTRVAKSTRLNAEKSSDDAGRAVRTPLVMSGLERKIRG